MFGSRVDDNKRGGDIDLLIETNLSDVNMIVRAELTFVTKLQMKLVLDKLSRLEKLGFIDNIENWQAIRNIRNKFTHDYPDDPDKNIAHLNIALKSVSVLYGILNIIHKRFKDLYPLLGLGKELPQYP